MTYFTDAQIDDLIIVRNRLTNVRSEIQDCIALDAIDSLLRNVPAGRRNDVDQLLGRLCAVPTPRADYGFEAN